MAIDLKPKIRKATGWCVNALRTPLAYCLYYTLLCACCVKDYSSRQRSRSCVRPSRYRDGPWDIYIGRTPALLPEERPRKLSLSIRDVNDPELKANQVTYAQSQSLLVQLPLEIQDEIYRLAVTARWGFHMVRLDSDRISGLICRRLSPPSACRYPICLNRDEDGCWASDTFLSLVLTCRAM